MPPNSAPCRRAPATRSPSSARRLRRAGSRAGSPCRRAPSRGCGAASPSCSKLLDDDGRRVRNLVAELAEDLLADELGREEALVAIGDVVVADRAAATAGSMLRDLRLQRRRARVPRSADTGTIAANSRSAAISRDARQQRALVRRRRSILLTRDDHRHASRQQRDDRAIRGGEARGVDDQHDDVDVGEAVAHRAVQPIVQRRAMLRLEAGRVDEDELRVAVASGCR